ncbi:MAG: hypothetical protein IJA87_00085 [Clostridia bacterium]|nr:hypothetical protein [Clostridia bacterium]
MDYRYLYDYRAFDDYNVLSNCIMSTNVGYNNLFLITGIVVTALYIAGLNNVFVDSSILVLKYGKEKYYKQNLMRVFIDSLLMSIEYIGTTVVFCLIFFNTNLLVESGFFICCLLYTVLVWLYFSIVGFTSYIVRIFLASKKIYVFVSAAIFFLLAGAKYISLEISPVYCCAFIDDWFSLGYFDVWNYALCIIKDVLTIVLLMLTGSWIFTKKDFLYEKT